MKKISKKEEVLPLELVKVTNDTKIEPVKAKQHAWAFNGVMQDFHRISSEIDLSNDTPEGLVLMKKKRLEIGKVRVAAESIKDDRKKLLLAEGNLIQSLFNVVKDTCLLTESEIKAVETKKEREETERINKLVEEREAVLEPYDYDTTFVSLDLMDDVQFGSLVETAKLLFETNQANALAEQEKEATRLKELEEENKRLKKEETARLELEEKAKEAKNKLFLARKPLLEKIGFEWIPGAKVFSLPGVYTFDIEDVCKMTPVALKDKIKEIVAIVDTRKKNKELEDQLAEAKKLEDARLKAIKDDQEAKALSLENAAKTPDKDKLKAFFDTLKEFELTIPKFNSKKGKEVESDIKDAFVKLKAEIINSAKKLI